MRAAPYYAPTPCNPHAWKAIQKLMYRLEENRGGTITTALLTQIKHDVAGELTSDYPTRHEMRAIMATAMEAGSAWNGVHEGFAYLNTFSPNSSKAEILEHMGAVQCAQFLEDHVTQSDAGYLLCYMGTACYNVLDKMVANQVPIWTWLNGWGEGHFNSYYVHGWMFGGSEIYHTNNTTRAQFFTQLDSARRQALYGYMSSYEADALYATNFGSVRSNLISCGYSTGGGGGGGGESPE